MATATASPVPTTFKYSSPLVDAVKDQTFISHKKEYMLVQKKIIEGKILTPRQSIALMEILFPYGSKPTAIANQLDARSKTALIKRASTLVTPEEKYAMTSSLLPLIQDTYIAEVEEKRAAEEAELERERELDALLAQDLAPASTPAVPQHKPYALYGKWPWLDRLNGYSPSPSSAQSMRNYANFVENFTLFVMVLLNIFLYIILMFIQLIGGFITLFCGFL